MLHQQSQVRAATTDGRCRGGESLKSVPHGCHQLPVGSRHSLPPTVPETHICPSSRQVCEVMLLCETCWLVRNVRILYKTAYRLIIVY